MLKTNVKQTSYKTNKPYRSPKYQEQDFNTLTLKLRGLHRAYCWICGKKLAVTFRPDGVRPVYCFSDLQKLKRGAVVQPKIKWQAPKFSYKKYFVPALSGALLVVLLIMVVLRGFTGLAETTYYYPTSCLGDFVGVDKIQKSSTSEVLQQFNLDNSAYYLGGLKQVYCGNFAGEPLDQAHITGVKLKVVWGYSPTVPDLNNAAPFSNLPLSTPEDSTPAQVNQVDNNQTDNTVTEPNTTNNASQLEQPVSAPEANSNSDTNNEPVSNPEPISFNLNKYFGFWQTAQAQEQSVEDIASTPSNEASLVSEPTPEPVNNEPTATVSNDNNEDVSNRSNNIETVNKSIDIIESGVVESLPAQASVPLDFEVKYSFDGSTWQDLASVSKDNLPTEFDLPVYNLDQIKNFQLLVKANNENFSGVLYIQSFVLEIVYEQDTKYIDPEPQPIISAENLRQDINIEKGRVVLLQDPQTSFRQIWFLEKKGLTNSMVTNDEQLDKTVSDTSKDNESVDSDAENIQPEYVPKNSWYKVADDNLISVEWPIGADADYVFWMDKAARAIYAFSLTNKAYISQSYNPEQGETYIEYSDTAGQLKRATITPQNSIFTFYNVEPVSSETE